MTPPKLCGDCGTQMEVNPDLFALPGLDAIAGANGQTGLQFNFNRALPVTVYICPNCGRFKFISAIFLNNIEALQPPAQQQALQQQQVPQQAPTPETAADEAMQEASANGGNNGSDKV